MWFHSSWIRERERIEEENVGHYDSWRFLMTGRVSQWNSTAEYLSTTSDIYRLIAWSILQRDFHYSMDAADEFWQTRIIYFREIERQQGAQKPIERDWSRAAPIYLFILPRWQSVLEERHDILKDKCFVRLMIRITMRNVWGELMNLSLFP